MGVDREKLNPVLDTIKGSLLDLQEKVSRRQSRTRGTSVSWKLEGIGGGGVVLSEAESGWGGCSFFCPIIPTLLPYLPFKDKAET